MRLAAVDWIREMTGLANDDVDRELERRVDGEPRWKPPEGPEELRGVLKGWQGLSVYYREKCLEIVRKASGKDGVGYLLRLGAILASPLHNNLIDKVPNEDMETFKKILTEIRDKAAEHRQQGAGGVVRDWWSRMPRTVKEMIE